MVNLDNMARTFLSGILLFFCVHQSLAQNITTGPSPSDTGDVIHLLNADILLGIQATKKDSSQLQKLIGNVRLQQGQTIFTCDSALQNLTNNTMDAYGHIHINQADTINTYSDFLHYEGDTKIATLKKNVRMTDGQMVLTTNLLIYDMDTHIGSYLNGGKLVNKSTVLTSQRGYYYADTKDVFFKKQVELVDPEYTLATDTLLYNTQTRIARFVAPTSINTGKSIIYTTCGYYNTVRNYSHLCNRSTIIDSSRHLTADSLNYDKESGIGKAYGNVIWTDTARHITVLANYAISDQTHKTILATQHPLMILERDSDTLFISSDTLFSGPVTRKTPPAPVASTQIPKDTTLALQNLTADSLKQILSSDTSTAILAPEPLPIPTDTTSPPEDELPTKPENDLISISTDTLQAGDSLQQKSTAPLPDTLNDSLLSITQSENPLLPDSIPSSADTLFPQNNKIPINHLASDSAATSPEDTSQLRNIIAYHHVKLFSDSLQAVADSLYYSDIDSAFHFFTDPVLWTGNSQLTGDTIVLFTKNQTADKILLQQHAMIVNKVGSTLFNQIKGTIITGYFMDDNQIKWMDVNGNAESIYYAQDDDGAFVGANHTTSSTIRLDFKKGEINKVSFFTNVDGTFIPPTQLKAEDKELSGFRWEKERRPQSKTDLMQ